MPLSNASRLADFGTGIGTAGAIIQVDNANQRLGVGTTAPTATLGVAGIVSATAFYGDGSNLDGVASAGLGTALSETEFDPLAVIYQTSDTLSVGATITVDPPDATTKVAYTQYADILLEDDADLIVADGDDFIPDILGLSTEGFSFNNANGNGIFDTVYTDNIENAAGRGAPNFPLGITVSGISTLSGNVSIGGTLTYEDVTNVDSIGIVTARSGIDITGASAGVNGSSNLTLKTGGTERLRIDSSGNILGAGGQLRLKAAVGDSNGLKLYQGGSDTSYILNHYSGPLVLGTVNTERLRIGTAGQIGLSGANYGTSGQVLTSQGASAAPQWAEAGGGALEIVETVALGNDFGSSYKDFVGFTTAYQEYRLVVTQLMGADNGAHDPRMHFFMDGTRNTGASSYTSYGMRSNTSAGVSGFNQPNTSAIRINNAESGTQYNMTITINQRPTHGSGTANNAWPNCYAVGTSNYQVFSSYGRMNDTADSTKNITGVRLFYGDGTNFAHGRLTLYRLKYS